MLSVGTFNRAEYHDENDPSSIALKKRLDALHLVKIDISQSLVILNGTLVEQRTLSMSTEAAVRNADDGETIGRMASVPAPGYIGDSTKKEVTHAREGSKQVYWWDIKAAMRLVLEPPSKQRQPWEWDAGDRPWTDLLPEERRRFFISGGKN